MCRTDGPVMPSPRAGSAMVRESSSVTMVRWNSDRPGPPYSSGTSIIQMPRSLARCWNLRQELRLDLLAFGGDGLALDRDQLVVDEAPQRFLEHPQFFGKLESPSRVSHAHLC